MIDQLVLTRAYRKLIRPLRRRNGTSPPQHTLADLSGPIVIAIAHPDDEVFCSGMICAMRERDEQVHLLCLTRGEGGERGALSPDADLGKSREKEMRAAADVLGVSSVTFLDYPDPPAANGKLAAPQVDSRHLVEQLRGHLQSIGAKAVITHGSSGEYWHPAHFCLHRHMRRAAKQEGLALWTFNAWDPSHPLPAILNLDDPAHLHLDGSRFGELRTRSLQQHESQKEVFRRFAGEELEDFIQLTANENYRKRSTLPAR